ncbi:MAG: isoaspartyl peptidase/L-asparaginase [Hyphomicrobiaceae bacterium]|nr:isoaspartyl peptidase/L-asparaginase [Hyphomicrobiaceae bacterium]
MAAPGNDEASTVLAIHGGAGTIDRELMTPGKEAAYRAALVDSLAAGQAVLVAGGSAVEAVIAAVRVMEDSPLFNAGHGAVFTSDGRNELDASIMDGATRAAGAVAGVMRIRNPVVAAHAVMTRSRHVMLIGAGAEAFAIEQGLELVEPSYFYTAERWAQLERARAAGRLELDHDGAMRAAADDNKFGTVGAVARDATGNLAAATSTGGMTNKRWGRVGDSPIIGAGTWAENATCAVSGTGLGEAFMRCCAAHEVAALMKYKGLTLDAAVTEVAMVTVPANGGTGGLIAADAAGNVSLRFSTTGMYRGVVRRVGAPEVAIYR